MAAKQGRRNGILYTFPALSWRTLVLFVCGACLLIVLATHVFPAYRAHVDYKMQRPWFPYSSMEVTVKDSPGEKEATVRDSPGEKEATVRDSPGEKEATVRDSPGEKEATVRDSPGEKEATGKDSPGEMEAIGKDSPGEANVKDSSVEVTVKVNPTESSDSYTVDFLFEHLVCLTAVSDNHFRESQDLFKSVRRCLPGKRFIVYDLGLNSRNREQLLRNYTNLELRPFPFNDYSHLPHVRNLYSYAWKPIIIDRVSKEYDVIMYGDASLRMISCDMTAAFEHLLKFPILNTHPISHHAIEFTHDGMIEYLHYPKARIDIAEITTLSAGGWLMWTNSFLKRKLIEPWLD